MGRRLLVVVLVLSAFVGAVVACSSDGASPCTSGRPTPVGTVDPRGESGVDPVVQDPHGGPLCDAYCDQRATTCWLTQLGDGAPMVQCVHEGC